MFALRPGTVLKIGGYYALSDYPELVDWRTCGSIASYDPLADAWTPAASLIDPRSDHSATLMHDGRVLIAGGNGYYEDMVFPAKTSAEVYDPATGTVSETGAMTRARYGHLAATLPSGEVLVVGHWEYGGGLSERYDPGLDSDGGTSPGGSCALSPSAPSAGWLGLLLCVLAALRRGCTSAADRRRPRARRSR